MKEINVDKNMRKILEKIKRRMSLDVALSIWNDAGEYAKGKYIAVADNGCHTGY